jgi:hypothetical protein
MIALISFIFTLLTHADPSWRWIHAIKIIDKHEFYKDNEVLVKPMNSWQHLFSVVYYNSQLSISKDCIFYRIPGEELGLLKIKTIEENQKCQDFLFLSGDQEWGSLKSVQFLIKKNYLSLTITHQNYYVEDWETPLLNLFQHPEPRIKMSSAKYRSPGIIFLSPQDEAPQKWIKSKMDGLKICHDISEDCREKTPSLCQLCPDGWYEVPNGCFQGPKFCGVIICGQKNTPACRRGFKYQKIKKKYKCGEDDSFVYCAKGLRVRCQGSLAYCM